MTTKELMRQRAEQEREEVHEAPSKVTMINAVMNAAQALRMKGGVIERLSDLRAHHNARYNQHCLDLGSMVKNKGAKWIEEWIDKAEAEKVPFTKPVKEADK